MRRALLIGKEPSGDLGCEYVTAEPYDLIVIGSLTLGELLQFQLRPQHCPLRPSG